ncbi:hypothetical protein Daesc_006676 [Daldinia eschscholtzii]|uniref:Bifunctional lycopene cyclase/phytoene synthase n=1 Tax=Daldinia eschscholtzii TaxID=292717 RepID=A0AAX6MI14_9PEZI
MTSMVYILLNKPVLHTQFLTNKDDSSTKSRRTGGRGTYLGLILIWACPVLLLTWSFSGYFLIGLPTTCVVLPIAVPTVYLWIIDELALGRGTWAIESGTKLGWCLWGSLELEEAAFFLLTNALIVFGLVAFDRALAVLYTFPELFPIIPEMPPPSLLARALLLDPLKYDMTRVMGIREAVQTLRRKSRSFYLASSVFPGRLRIDLVLLVADDLIDESHTKSDALIWIQKLTSFLDHVYGSENTPPSSMRTITNFVQGNFPKTARSALTLLPTKPLPSKPFYELLEGFKMDLSFGGTDSRQRARRFPIQDEADLELYAHRVASTVGELCLRLVFHHSTVKLPSDKESILVIAAHTMGHALQYVNIARDILVDAEIGRVYLPSNWLKQENLTPQGVIKDPRQPRVEGLRQKLLDWAFREYGRSRETMNMLPREVRGPLIVAVENYMEIGRVLRERTGVPSKTRKGRATVPRSRRIWVAWKNLSAA